MSDITQAITIIGGQYVKRNEIIKTSNWVYHDGIAKKLNGAN